MDRALYHASEWENARTADLLGVLPRGRSSVLDVGSRDGHFARFLGERFDSVTLLDLIQIDYDHPRVRVAVGDATELPFGDNSFDTVVCTEMLEHVAKVDKAAREIVRVARHDIVVGVPYRQDIRFGRVTCRACGKISPPWAHVNSFDEARLAKLFSGCEIVSQSFAGRICEHTNAASAWLMDLGGNPWGTYDQEEGCIHCGARLQHGGPRPLWQRCCSALALGLQTLQSRLTTPHANWIHVVFSKNQQAGAGIISREPA